MSVRCYKNTRGIATHLRPVAATLAGPAQIGCHGAASTHFSRLQDLLQEAGARLRLEPASSQAAESTRNSDQTATNGSGPRAETAMGEPALHGFAIDGALVPGLRSLISSSVRLFPVQGLYGVLKGLAPELRTVIASVPTTADPDTLLACSRLASRSAGSESTVTVVDQPRWHEHLASGKHGLAVASCNPPRAMKSLIEGCADLMILPESLGPAFGSAAVILSGTSALAVEIRGADDVLLFGHQPVEGEAVEPTALALNAVWLLLALGQYDAAESLHNAVLATLEDGLYCGTLRLLNPYTRLLEADEMFDALQERLKKPPSRLQPVHYSPHKSGRGMGPRLQLIG